MSTTPMQENAFTNYLTYPLAEILTWQGLDYFTNRIGFC